ncbi:MAG: hypothetical protein KDK66_06620 [Deltaproteobacteria bacterium]|nr:hypothetical protein [Deltaproteobacteria bacterium]
MMKIFKKLLFFSSLSLIVLLGTSAVHAQGVEGSQFAQAEKSNKVRKTKECRLKQGKMVCEDAKPEEKKDDSKDKKSK